MINPIYKIHKTSSEPIVIILIFFKTQVIPKLDQISRMIFFSVFFFLQKLSIPPFFFHLKSKYHWLFLKLSKLIQQMHIRRLLCSMHSLQLPEVWQ